MNKNSQKGLAPRASTELSRTSSSKGFTLIELAAVIGVVAVVSAVLLVNNRLNERQISLSTDAAGIAGAISRAKALTLQNLSGDICGYGAYFESSLVVNSRDSYVIFNDLGASSGTCDSIYTGSNEILSGQESRQELGSGIRFESSGSDYLLKDVAFYSSDAKVKLTGYNGASDAKITQAGAGLVIVQTESAPVSYITLKITSTGQVTTKSGRYITIDGFDAGVLAQPNANPGIEPPIESCIPDCSCTAGLSTGQTCSDTCGGICYAGSSGPGSGPGPQCSPLPTDCQTPNNTCGDVDFCGAPCKTCSANFACVGKACLPYNCAGKKCGDLADGSGLSCPGSCPPLETCEKSNNIYQCAVTSVDLKLDSVIYQGQTKPDVNKSQ